MFKMLQKYSAYSNVTKLQFMLKMLQNKVGEREELTRVGVMLPAVMLMCSEGMCAYLWKGGGCHTNEV